jgi:hypothetical protein
MNNGGFITFWVTLVLSKHNENQNHYSRDITENTERYFYWAANSRYE